MTPSWNPPWTMWRKLWASLPLSYKLALFGLATVMTATFSVLVVTYSSAQDSLKLQLERQLSRDLNVFEKWYRTRLEEMQLTAVGLARHPELNTAIAQGRIGAAEALLDAERQRLQVEFALLVDGRNRLVTAEGLAGRFDPDGLVSAARARNEQLASTEAWQAQELGALPSELRQSGLVRVVVTPLAHGGALVLGERLAPNSSVPNQVVSMIGGGIALTDLHGVVSANGFPGDSAPSLSPAIWSDIAAGRYFFTEAPLRANPYLLAFRPITDHQGTPIGAFVRGFPESEIAETLYRYAGSIFVLAAAAVLFSTVAFLWLTQRLLLPMKRLARISWSLATDDAEWPARGREDEFARLESGVAKLADRWLQSREELAEAAIRLEADAVRLAERNAQLAALNDENARLLAAIREHDHMRGQLLEKVISAQEDERKRVARELHDQTGQSLTSLLVGLKFVEGAGDLSEMKRRTAQLKGLAVATLEEVHKLSLALRPAMLDDLGLVVAVRSLVKDFGAQHGLATTVQADALEGRLPGVWEVTLYRVVQEALTNVAKYAGASRVDVRFALEGHRLLVSIDDDGVGFDPAALNRGDREHLGLLGMQERVSLIGGEFRLHTAPGDGTRIEVRAELPPALTPPSAEENPHG